MNRLLLFAIALLVVGVAAVALLLLGSAPGLDARAADILADLSAGDSDGVWEAASPGFQSRYPQARFAALMKDFHETLGTFQRIVGREVQGQGAGKPETEPAVDTRGAQELTFELQYSKGTAFCYMVLDDHKAPAQLRELLLRKSSGSTQR